MRYVKIGIGASCGGLYRNNLKVWLGGFHNFIGECNSFDVELWEVFLGLELAWKHGFKKVIVQVDNKFVVDALQGSSWLLKQGSNLITHILLLLPHFEEVQFHCIFKEANQYADYLAKLDMSGSFEVSWFDECPLALRSVFRMDWLCCF